MNTMRMKAWEVCRRAAVACPRGAWLAASAVILANRAVFAVVGLWQRVAPKRTIRTCTSSRMYVILDKKNNNTIVACATETGSPGTEIEPGEFLARTITVEGYVHERASGPIVNGAGRAPVLQKLGLLPEGGLPEETSQGLQSWTDLLRNAGYNVQAIPLA